MKPKDDDLIDELLEPIRKIYDETNYKVLAIISNRIKQIGEMSATDAHRPSVLLKNEDIADIERLLSEATGKTVKEIDAIVEESAKYNDELAEEMYKARNMPPITYRQNKSLLSAIEVAKKSMIDDVVRFSNTRGFLINGKMTSVSKAYNYAINRATFEVQQGLFDYNTAMKSTIRELARSGIVTVDFESGYKRRLDSQVRMNISDGIRNLNAGYREAQGKLYGADGVELSAHGLCADDHLPYQGRQFTNKEFEKLQASLERPFFKMNCKHSMTLIILGISEPSYSDKELREIAKTSTEKVKYTLPGGKEVEKTRYVASQDQRAQETKIRKLKEIKKQYEITDSKNDIAIYNRKIKEETLAYKKMSQQMGIAPKLDRLRVYS